jgi:hypothetical protein
LLMPDKMKRTTISSPFPGFEFTRTDVINGDQVWVDVDTSTPPASPGGAGGPMIRMGPGGPGGPGRPGGGNPEMIQNFTRTEFHRLLLGIVVIPPASIQAEYKYAGEAKAPDGTADVIEVKGPGNSASRVYVDQKTHRVLMISFRGRNFQTFRGRRGGGPPGQPGPEGQPGRELTPEEIEKRRKEIEERMAMTPEVDFFIRFAEHKNVNGLSLPHLITRSTGSNINEELTIDKYKLNPKLNPDKFVKKEKN